MNLEKRKKFLNKSKIILFSIILSIIIGALALSLYFYKKKKNSNNNTTTSLEKRINEEKKEDKDKDEDKDEDSNKSEPSKELPKEEIDKDYIPFSDNPYVYCCEILISFFIAKFFSNDAILFIYSEHTEKLREAISPLSPLVIVVFLCLSIFFTVNLIFSIINVIIAKIMGYPGFPILKIIKKKDYFKNLKSFLVWLLILIAIIIIYAFRLKEVKAKKEPKNYNLLVEIFFWLSVAPVSCKLLLNWKKQLSAKEIFTYTIASLVINVFISTNVFKDKKNQQKQENN